MGQGNQREKAPVQGAEGEEMNRVKAFSFLAVMALFGALVIYAQGPASATGAASVGLTGQTANVASTPISPALDPVIWNRGGMYRASCYVIETTADAASSTLPACNVIFTDADTGNSHTVALTATSTANTVDTIGAGTTGLPWGSFHPKKGTAISYSSSSYASGTAATMQYSLHFRLEYIGF
jgi:hypothetical protein